ncbi:MAG: cell division protein ZapA [Boseongicola sp.]|nr:cell division protein ZapA [Boseongicola sp.]
MSKSVRPIAVQILDKEYRVACEPGEEAQLITAAKFLDDRMRDIRGTGKVIGTDRIAVMAALNIANELLAQKERASDDAASVGTRVRDLRDRIEVALNESNQLEL